jgi:hypothetical protein
MSAAHPTHGRRLQRARRARRTVDPGDGTAPHIAAPWILNEAWPRNLLEDHAVRLDAADRLDTIETVGESVTMARVDHF